MRSSQCGTILPVFAGMVPRRGSVPGYWSDSPRIRGDGPKVIHSAVVLCPFSPYSRGWSRPVRRLINLRLILPVFAGMVPEITRASGTPADSPRIRGDGPPGIAQQIHDVKFSPYSRGWSLFINKRLDGRNNSPRIRGDGPGRNIAGTSSM